MSLILPWTNKKNELGSSKCKGTESYCSVICKKNPEAVAGQLILLLPGLLLTQFWMFNTFWRISECQTLTDSFTRWLPCFWVYDSLTGILRVHLIILCKSPCWMTLMTILIYTHNSSKLKLPHCILFYLLHLLAPGIFVLFSSLLL